MDIKKYIALCLIMAFLVVVAGFSLTNATNSLTVTQNANCENSVVDKTQGQVFTVKICLKNTGGNEGNWSVNVAFEGDSWSWVGCAQNLTLRAGETKALVWTGDVPVNASIGSVDRLVVYYGDSFTALNWWIRVVPDAELNVTSSSVW